MLAGRVDERQADGRPIAYEKHVAIALRTATLYEDGPGDEQALRKRARLAFTSFPCLLVDNSMANPLVRMRRPRVLAFPGMSALAMCHPSASRPHAHVGGGGNPSAYGINVDVLRALRAAVIVRRLQT